MRREKLRYCAVAAVAAAAEGKNRRLSNRSPPQYHLPAKTSPAFENQIHLQCIWSAIVGGGSGEEPGGMKVRATVATEIGRE